jgi:phosphotransferase system HPr-like phosphotransfer protein
MVMKARENPWQPPPQFVEEQVNVSKEVVNEEVDEDQICVKITGSDMLRATNATYIKYYLFYDGQKCLTNHFLTNSQDTRTYYHTLPSANLLKGIRDYECQFTLKRQKLIRKKVLDKGSIKLTQLGSHASLEKTVMLQGAKITVEIMLRTAANKKVFAVQTETITVLGPLPDPFKGEAVKDPTLNQP